MNKPAKIAGTESVEDVLKKLDEQRAANLRHWNALAKTDPQETKQFSRAGGFKGTAIKPIWVVKRLTELFGPCGEGWGIGEPRFEIVHGDNKEVLVYCTVECWHGTPANKLYGVGGDKVVTYIKANPQYNRPERWENDDEAFKKAFTDAVNNAFKFVGVAADIHMGLFDDSKYVAAINAEFHPPEDPKPDPKQKEGDFSPTALRGAIKMLVRNINGCSTVRELDELLELQDAQDVMEQCERRFPAWWSTGEGCPPEFVPLQKLIDQTRQGLAQLENA